MLMLGKKLVSPLCMPYAGIEKATNCLLEVPQKLNMSINDNIFTIKAGSTIVLYGETYTTYTLTQDTVVDYSSVLPIIGDGIYYIFANVNGGVNTSSWININHCFSGTPLPDVSGYSNGDIFFETTEKKRWYNNNGEWIILNGSYPLGFFNVKNHQLSFAKDDNGNDIIFNDFSIIGHHYIGYPNNNLALGCDGFNTDGSYKTTHIHRGSLLIFELPKTNVSYILHPNGTLFGGGYDPNSQSPYEEVNELPTTYVAANIYVKDENQIYRWSDSLKDYHIENNSLYYGYINLSSDGIFRSMAIQPPLTKYRWVVKLIP